MKKNKVPGPGDDLDDVDTAEGVDLPGVVLSHEELLIHVVSIQDDEFISSSCFLVHPHRQLACVKNNEKH